MTILPELLDAGAAAAALEDLTEVLHATVMDGASVGFVAPFSRDEARAFWEGLLPALRRGGRVMWGVRQNGRIVGTVQLVLEGMPNQVHKAEVSKMLVHPAYRRQGIARALMLALLARAGAEGRRLLVLDTRSGDVAQPLYAALGFEVGGEIPDYALAPDGSGRLDATTYMYRRLSREDARRAEELVKPCGLSSLSPRSAG